MDKYAPLREYLSKQPEAEVTLGFSDISRIIGTDLPESAFNHRPWWANDGTHVQAQAWMRVGWRVAEANLSRGVVTFARA